MRSAHDDQIAILLAQVATALTSYRQSANLSIEGLARRVSCAPQNMEALERGIADQETVSRLSRALESDAKTPAELLNALSSLQHLLTSSGVRNRTTRDLILTYRARGGDIDSPIDVTDLLGAVFDRARTIQGRRTIRYASVLVALADAPDDAGGLLRRLLADADLRSVLKEADVNYDDYVALRADTSIGQDQSANHLFISATLHKMFSDNIGILAEIRKPDNRPFETRDILALLSFYPTRHDRELESAGLSREALQSASLRLLSATNPREAEAWLAAFPGTRDSVGKGLIRSSYRLNQYITSDIWTTVDSLGFDHYANTIAEFLCDQGTKPPLSISVQAAWGAGKSSLMRMVQARLDPTAVPNLGTDIAQEQGGPIDASSPGVIRIRQLLAEIETWLHGTGTSTPRTIAAKERCTVWFNAWKYENTNQLWAGLVDAIVKQVASRMLPVEREVFYVRLNLARLDADKVRRAIYSRIYKTVLSRAVPVGFAFLAGVVILAAATIASREWFPVVTHLPAYAATVGLIGTITASVRAGLVYFGARKEVLDEKAVGSMGDVVRVPDYERSLGFVHQVDADIRHVMQAINPRYLPLVVFVDDLDRCSPQRVAQVMEAVNLFLAGDLPECMFVIGMDAEMVAAALEFAHKDVLDQLPSQAKIPVGWRYMDKFVQLPFVIPPLRDQAFSLLGSARNSTGPTLDDDAGGNLTNRPAGAHFDGSRESGDAKDTHPASAPSSAGGENGDLSDYKSREVLIVGETNKHVREVIESGLAFFRSNPREAKRFINAYRFNVRLRETGDRLSLEQVMRWTVFALRWPDALRWIRRADPMRSAGVASVPNRYAELEYLTGGAADIHAWSDSLTERYGLRGCDVWKDDPDLFHFLREETGLPAGSRISAGAGLGLW